MSAPLSQNDGPGQTSDAPAQSLAKSHPILLMAIIGMGIAIIVVLALMVGMIVKGTRSKPDASKPQATASVPVPEAGPGAPANYNTMVVREGTTIADARIEGGMLVLRTTSDEADEVMTFDPKTGQLLARITLKKSDTQ
jgi:hypothetical protein